MRKCGRRVNKKRTREQDREKDEAAREREKNEGG
jgi:hypothetical protein